METDELGIYNEEYVNNVLSGGYHKLPVGIAVLPEYSKWIGTAEFRVFNFLNCTIVRGRRRFDPLSIYTNYYLKGKLACSWAERVLENFLKMDRGNINRHTKSLSDKGFLVREKQFNVMANKDQFIYIMGEIKITGIGNIENIFAYKKIWDNEKHIAKKSVADVLDIYYKEEFSLDF